MFIAVKCLLQSNVYSSQMFILIFCLFLAFEESDSVRLVYVPSHLYHMLFELFKVTHYFILRIH